MHLVDIVLLLLSALIVIIVGFLPLITAQEDPATRIERECHFFYDAAGPAAVQHCQTEMKARSALKPQR